MKHSRIHLPLGSVAWRHEVIECMCGMQLGIARRTLQLVRSNPT